MRDLARRRRMWTEEKALQRRIADLRRHVTDDDLKELNGIANKLKEAVSWLGNLVDDHHRPEAEELQLFESVELMMQSATGQIDDKEKMVGRPMKEKKQCPKCGKEMRFVPGQNASFVAPGGVPQFTPARWECECGYK